MEPLQPPLEESGDHDPLSNPKSLGGVAVNLLLKRKAVRRDLNAWCRHCGFEPAQHHRLLNETLQDVVAGRVRNVMFLLPPGSAKSTYISVLFPPWFLRQKPTATILACSYSYTLIEGFGKRCRNLIKQHENVLGYSLSPDSQAAGEWTTTLGGRYFCAGVGAGLAGHRADLAFIDDFLGSEEDADSKIIRDKQWAWYNNDFWPRLKPNAAQVIVANRRHEEDLVGMILAREPGAWRVVKIPFFAVENDPLGRRVGERIWPEWFTEEQAAAVKKLPGRTQAGLYGQDPNPEEGDYFKKEWFVGYRPSELPPDEELRFYASSDFAVSEEADRDLSCLIPFAVDHRGHIWILPDVRWHRYGPKELIAEFISMIQRRKPMAFFAENGQIKKSLGPFLEDQMMEEKAYAWIKGITAARAKDVRARSIQGRMSLKTVHFPKFADWWPQAEHEMLMFPGGKHDDFVDALAYTGLGLQSLGKGQIKPAEAEQPLNPSKPITMGMIKAMDTERKRLSAPAYEGR